MTRPVALPPYRTFEPGLTAAERLFDTPPFAAVLAVLPDTREAAQAAVALAELIALAGWRRLKRCATCGRAFVDRTNGCSRRWCDDHRRGG